MNTDSSLASPRSEPVHELTGVLLGSWGHYGEVLHEFDASGGALRIAGIAAVREEDGDTPAARIMADYACAAGARVAEDADALLRELRPDFAVASARPDRLAPLAALAASHGCHVISEKPLALDLSSLDSLRAAIDSSGTRILAMLSNRARPALAAGVAAIRDGAIGRVTLLSARKTYKFGTRPQWFGDRAAYGGTIPWIGIHALDFFDAATGGVPIKDVAAFHANLAHPAFPGCEDACALIFRFENGALGTATLDYFRPEAADCPHGDDGLRVIGTCGELTVDIDRGRAVLLTAEGMRELPLPPRGSFYAPWLFALPPRGERAEPDEATLRAFRLTREALRAREVADLP